MVHDNETDMSVKAGSSPNLWTYAEYARLPDDGEHYEVIDGEVLVTPAPATGHQHIVGNLYVLLRAYVERYELGIMMYDVDLLFVTGQFLRPDLVYVPMSGRAGLTDRSVEVAPTLVVEVLSPSSRSIDLVKKPNRYRDFGVPEYWAVDPFERVIWRWDLAAGTSPDRFAQDLIWHPDAAVAALTVSVAEVLRTF